MKRSLTTAIVVLLWTQHVIGEPLAEVVAGAAANGNQTVTVAATAATRVHAQRVDYCVAPPSWRAAWWRTTSTAAAPRASTKKTDSMLTLCALFAMGLIAYRRLNDSGS